MAATSGSSVGELEPDVVLASEAMDGSVVLGREERGGAGARLQVLKHTELLNGEAADVWTACKHAVALLPDLAPQYFSKAEFDVGWGGLGSVGVFHFGAAMPRGGSVKHRIDKLDDDTQTLAYTVIEGDTANYSFEMQFVATEDNKATEATWMLKYEPVVGDEALATLGPTLEEAKELVVITLKTFEQAVKERRIVRHTRTLEAHVDSIWNIFRNEDVILPKVIPQFFASFEYLEGNGEPGSIRLLQLGHAIPGGKHVIERIDINDPSTKTWGYTVLQGDPNYKYLSAVMQFVPGPRENTTVATWVGVCVPQTHTISQPKLVLDVWKVFESEAKASLQVAY